MTEITNPPVDVLIVGAGASGAAVAWSLADTKMRIVCLEQGGWPDQSRYPTTGRDWEARAAEDFALSPNRRGLPADYPINDDNSPIKVVNFNGVGGGTVLYAAHFPRLHPSDFRVRTLDGVADDWPIDYRTLEPFFALNDRMMGVASLAGDPAYPPKEAALPPLPLGRTGEVMGRAMNKLGWHWWPSDGAIASRDYEGRARCINLGHCMPACAQGAKASTDITYWQEAVRARVEVRTHCRVSRIETNDDCMATGVHYFDRDGRKVFQPAEIVIMACNGVGTPRLLLNSASERFPDGLANSSGLVGKNLMFHPYALVRGRFDEPLDGYRGPRIFMWSMQFYETDKSRGFVRGYGYQFLRGYAPVTTAINGMGDGLIPWGDGHHAAFRRLFGYQAGLASICEDLPEEINRVTLDPHLKDGNGIPAPKIDYRLSENSQRMLDHSVARGIEVLQAAGAHDIVSKSPLLYAGWHLLGTARMGTDPKRSVVNEWGRSHDVRNLFIVDGSVFVTSGGVNPTSSIQAIALYIADRIKSRIYDLFD
jgi:choline dehydrogenase-like flavoprotein